MNAIKWFRDLIVASRAKVEATKGKPKAAIREVDEYLDWVVNYQGLDEEVAHAKMMQELFAATRILAQHTIDYLGYNNGGHDEHELRERFEALIEEIDRLEGS